MSNLSIKDVPEAWAQALRQRAALNHRSLQGELMAILQAAVHETAISAPSPQLQRHRTGWKTVEQVVAGLNAKYPNGPAPGQGSSIEMIREDRDSR